MSVKINWSEIPEKYNYVSRDGDEWYAYKNKPVYKCGVWCDPQDKDSPYFIIDEINWELVDFTSCEIFERPEKSSKHPHDAVIRAWLDGETIQLQYEDGSWTDLRTLDARQEMGHYSLPAFDTNRNYRIKPKTIVVNGIEVPEPIRSFNELKTGDEVYVYYPFSRTGVCGFTWDDEIHKEIFKLESGILFSTREGVEMYIRAINSIFGKK